MTKRYRVERYDDEDGNITYEIWDGMRRICRISEDESETRAQARVDANTIVRALNAVVHLANTPPSCVEGCFRWDEKELRWRCEPKEQEWRRVT